ncbi:MAG TPA: fumarylacetoacetate hydrolase family protein [Actinomycetales bacterium]
MIAPALSTDELAAYLDDAQRTVAEVEQLDIGLTLEQAYDVQRAVLARRVARGERVVGAKLGFTSAAKMAQMGISDIIVGEVTDAMAVADGGDVDLGRFIHPRIEPEVAFRLARDVDLADPHVDVVAAVDAVAPALEIIDSRYRAFRFSLPDVVADNTSAAAYVLGSWTPIAQAGDLGVLAVRLVVDGADAETGSSADILGHPLAALRALVPLARGKGLQLPAGHVVLAGAATAAVPFGESRVEAHVAGLGFVRVRGVRG